MNKHLLKNSSKMKTKNIIISGTNFWNPGDDFVRDGVIRILKKLFEEYTLNFLFYNFNQDFYPQSKFSGVHNMAAAGDLDKYRDFVDAIVIAGLSAGREIKDLYNWIIKNGLLDRVYLIGAGYANTYVDKNISQEPEATIFRNAGIITGRTEKKPNFITELGLPYHHINCPAMLSVEHVKAVPPGKKVQTIGFSIQLPHRKGVVNHCCDASMYQLAAHSLLELFPRYNVEIIAHHKEEYFHFLNLVKGHNIPVFFSSFYQDLYEIYRRYDLVISTRLHACIFANSHGIPGIIINDTDRHTHCAHGFPHLTWVNTREKLHLELENICRQDLKRIANDNTEFKENLMQKYLEVLAGPFGIESHFLDSKGMPRTHPNSEVYRHPHNKGNLTQQPAGKDEITSKLFYSVCSDTNAKRRVLQTISQLTKDHWLERNIEMFKAAIDSNVSWFETLSFLNWYAANFKPNNYLEVGVRRGRSLVQVLTQSPETKAYGFDTWIPEYAGVTNPGPDFVVSELNKLRVKNLPTLITGDSHETLPRFWSDTQNPQQFELILVDGDHTYNGAKKDLEICFAHLAPGGALLFDDIRHPSHPWLKDLWEEYKNKFSDYIFIEHSHGCGTGVAFKPPFNKLGMYLDIDKREAKNSEPNAGRPVRKKEQMEVQTASSLPVHFFTIVLNGQPFIRHHIEVFKQLPFKWHWHIIEGVADLKHDTAWSVKLGGRINEQLHRNGLSNDGTAEYIDELVQQYPENITVYRKPEGVFWDGKLEMVNAPLADITEECLLWQIDSDELWTTEQICTCRDMFIAEPDRTAAYYLDHFFVGENLVTTTINTYGNNTGYEWLRTWRFRPGYRWTAHEPPRLCMHGRDGQWVDIATIKPFKHDETSAKKLIFQHYAYTTEKQLAFKEIYYGYNNAVAQWQHLQQHGDFPVLLKEYFAWVKDGAQVNTIRSQNITPLAWKDTNGQWRFSSCQPAQKQQITRLSKDHKKILIVRPDSIGDFVIFSGILEHFREIYKDAGIHILLQEHIAELAQNCPYIDEVITFERKKLMHNQVYSDGFIEKLKSKKFDVAINPVYSRDSVGDFLTLNSGADTKIASTGDESNMPSDEKLANDSAYTRLIPASDEPMLETVRNVEFINNLALRNICEQCTPRIWIEREDETKIDKLLSNLNVQNPLVICPFSQHAIKDWPLQKWAELIAKYKNYPILICGSGKNRSQADGLINLSDHNNLHNLCGRITLRQLAALLTKSRICVGADTGSIHIAGAVGCPHVVITGGGHFGRFIPYSPGTTLVYLPMKCYQCNWRCKYGQARCITQIRVETVDTAVRQALDSSKATRSEPVLIEENLEIDSVPTGPSQINLKPLADVDISEIGNDSKYLVTAIVSTYNAEQFIAGCLDDLERQTIADNLEIIVVNSGSQENEEAIVREFQQRYDNIKYIKTEQRETLYNAWNRAIKAARGKFITTANTDDRHRKDAFEALSDALQEYPDVSLVYGDCYVSTKPNENYEENSKSCIYHYPEFLAVDAILFYQFGPQPMWRKNVHETIGYFDESYKAAGDHDFNIRFSMHFKALHIDEPLGLYLKHSEAISFKDNTMRQEQQRIVFDYRKPEIVEKLYRQVGITADTAEEKARIFLDMGVRAMECYPPWKEGRAEHHLDFAFQCFNKAAEFRPDWAAAYNNLAVVLGLSGNLGSAEKLLEKAADMTQDSTISFNLKLISDPLPSIQFSSGAKLLHSGLSLPSQKEVSLKRKLSESLTQTFLSLPQESIGNSMGLKVLFYFDRIGNFSQSSPAGTIMAIRNFAKSLLRNKPDTRIYLTGDLVNYLEQYESFRVIPLPPPEQREQFITDYDVIFFATHVRYFKGLTKPSGQIWVLWQHCWEAGDRVSLSHSSDFDAVICLSEQHRSSLRSKYFGDEKFITIPNLIDTNVYSPKEVIRNNHSIMFAGGLNPHKCVHILLDAFRLVRQQVKDVELHIYGDGKMWRGGDTYGNELKSIKPEGTYFHGYVDNKDMPQIYSKHSILCLPSKLESFGLVTVEAQACGCVPVVHNAGGVDATLADGETGLLYSPNTPEKLAETIIKSLKIVDADTSIRQKAVNFARNTFSINRAAEYISQLWDKINIAKKVNTIRTLLKGNEIEQANLKCKELLQEYPNDPDVLLSQALIMLQQGYKTKANVAIEKLLENFPNHLRALNDCGLTAMKAGDTEKALRYLTKAYKFNPWDKDTVTNYYAMLKTSGRYRDAKILLLNYLTNVGEDAQVLQLFREIDNLIANAGSGTKAVSQEVLNNRQDIYCESSANLPLVSIITPVYNGADYIGQTIESVLAQDYPNFELVIIDDGSTDNTKEVTLRYNDGRIRYLYQENKGVSSARNLAISKAGGQYIMPLDADDMMTPDSIARHLMEFEKHPEADLVYCDVLLIDDRNKPIRIMNKPEYQDRRHLIRDLFRAGHPVLPFRLGIRRSVFDKIGFYDEDLLVGEDYDMMRRFIKAGLKAHHLNEPLHLRRTSAESLTRNYSPYKTKCHFDVVSRFTDTFTYEELFPDVAWDEIPFDTRRLHAKCLAVVTYLAIGQDFSQSKSASIYAKTAFERACSELRDCLEMDPNNSQIRALLQKCELGRQKCQEQVRQAVC